jgi:hypothetical protein
MKEQASAFGGVAAGLSVTGGGDSAAAAIAQTLLTRECGKLKMIKELLMSATTGTPCMVGLPAVVKNSVDDAVRICAKKQQLIEASVYLRKQCEIFEKRARAAMMTLRETKLKLRPLWLTHPINHQIKICIGSDTYGGVIPCTARYHHLSLSISTSILSASAASFAGLMAV